jgi:hypothetical protein
LTALQRHEGNAPHNARSILSKVRVAKSFLQCDENVLGAASRRLKKEKHYRIIYSHFFNHALGVENRLQMKHAVKN